MTKQQKVEHWEKLFEQHQRGGLSITQFCRNNKINTSAFYAWRNRLAGKKLPPKSQQVVPFVINEQPATQSSTIKLTTPHGYQLEFEATLTGKVLAQLLSVL